MFFVLLCINPIEVMSSRGEPDLSNVMTEVRSRYDNISDLKADFLHRVPLALTGTALSEKGSFSFRKPANLRWEYSDPPGKMMVMNRQYLWLYLPDDNIVYQQKTETAMASQIAARFLTDLGELDRDFHISFACPSRDDQGNYLIELKPRDPLVGIHTLTLSINSENYLLSGYMLTDHYGTTNSYYFSNISVNIGLSDDLFLFEPPSGVRIEILP
ncbi:MAG: outer membrane lipoprotein carrier protein LolA [Syntrophales bacterium]|nr:outer membrane lipoprotein carrier protein LolA [Syntrophales bacterium]